MTSDQLPPATPRSAKTVLFFRAEHALGSARLARSARRRDATGNRDGDHSLPWRYQPLLTAHAYTRTRKRSGHRPQIAIASPCATSCHATWQSKLATSRRALEGDIGEDT